MSAGHDAYLEEEAFSRYCAAARKGTDAERRARAEELLAVAASMLGASPVEGRAAAEKLCDFAAELISGLKRGADELVRAPSPSDAHIDRRAARFEARAPAGTVKAGALAAERDRVGLRARIRRQPR